MQNKKLPILTALLINSYLLLGFVANAAEAEADTTILKSYLNPLDEQLNESSGLMPWKDLLWTFNDSGGEPEIYGVATDSGNIVRTVRLNNAQNVDWEDITQDETYIYIGDFGNNYGVRRDLTVYRIVKDSICDTTYQEVAAEFITFNYKDQQSFFPAPLSTSYDCEGMVSHGDSLLLFSKDWKHHITTTYRLPKTPGNYTLQAGEVYDCDFMVTGADISTEGKLALIGYKNFRSYLLITSIDSVSVFKQPKKIDLSYMGYVQTEAICFTKDKLLISCEETPLYKAQIWEVLPRYWK